ncbi:hypothetical protein, partial [Candidatus Entotheonella palauensis]|uniref:hypothetical protein n=1 Tax=Candidatus Entotheonella palauensis TaxID=93172 RepID=UPI00352FFB1C
MSNFKTSFDSMIILEYSNVDRLYVEKGAEYIRYSDSGSYTVIDGGYPQRLDGGNWGNLPPNFRDGFDSMAVMLYDNVQRLYVTKGTEYIRYSDAGSYTVVDSGYPQ